MVILLAKCPSCGVELEKDAKFCPKCGSLELGELHKDKRYKCKNCHHKFSPNKNKPDFNLMTFFDMLSTANKAYKFLKGVPETYNDSKMVYRRFMKYRREIFEYTEKHKVPEQPSILKIMKIPKPAIMTGRILI